MAEPVVPHARRSVPLWRGPFVVGDVLRALALVSVVVATWRFGLVATALFLLVLGGTFLPRAVGVPASLDAAYCATLLFAAWAAQLDWYVAVGWLDLAVHAVATGLIAVVALRALTEWGVVGRNGPRGQDAAFVIGAGGVLAVLWELGEWAGNALLDPRIQVGYRDTVTDLGAGLLGSVVAAAVLVRRR